MPQTLVPQVLIAEHRQEAASLKAELGLLKRRYLERKKREHALAASAPAPALNLTLDPSPPDEGGAPDADPPAAAAGGAALDLRVQREASPQVEAGMGIEGGRTRAETLAGASVAAGAGELQVQTSAAAGGLRGASGSAAGVTQRALEAPVTALREGFVESTTSKVTGQVEGLIGLRELGAEGREAGGAAGSP